MLYSDRICLSLSVCLSVCERQDRGSRLVYRTKTHYEKVVLSLVDVCEGIRMRECDGGTAWDRVKSEEGFPAALTQGIQVSWISYGW